MFKFFWFCAVAGTGMFVIQLMMTLLGSDMDDSHAEDGKFKWKTRQALTGFFMMFGWSALTCALQFHFSLLPTFLIALTTGLLAAFITSLIFRLAKKAHSSGTVFNIDDSIGKEALVYHRIPKQGSGKITVSLHDITHEIDAISEGDEIASFTQVQIIKKMDDKTVIVAPKT